MLTYIDDLEAECLPNNDAINNDEVNCSRPDKEADVDNDEVVAESRAEVGDPEGMNCWAGQHGQPWNLQCRQVQFR